MFPISSYSVPNCIHKASKIWLHGLSKLTFLTNPANSYLGKLCETYMHECTTSINRFILQIWFRFMYSPLPLSVEDPGPRTCKVSAFTSNFQICHTWYKLPPELISKFKLFKKFHSQTCILGLLVINILLNIINLLKLCILCVWVCVCMWRRMNQWYMYINTDISREIDKKYR